jgi:hypothetical protein
MKSILFWIAVGIVAWLATSVLDIYRLGPGWAVETWPTFMSCDIIVTFNGVKLGCGDI